MKMRSVGLVLLLMSPAATFLFPGSGFAQSSSTGVITTYAGRPLPAGDIPILSDPFAARSVIADGAGGFIFGSSDRPRVYRVGSDNTVRVIAGTGISGFSGDG